MRVYVHLYVAITHKYLLLHYRRTLGIVVMGWCFEMEIRYEAGSSKTTVDACLRSFVRSDYAQIPAVTLSQNPWHCGYGMEF
jgi:hypothetical protein